MYFQDETIFQTLKNISNNTESPTDSFTLSNSPGCIKKQTSHDNLRGKYIFYLLGNVEFISKQLNKFTGSLKKLLYGF